MRVGLVRTEGQKVFTTSESMSLSPDRIFLSLPILPCSASCIMHTAADSHCQEASPCLLDYTTHIKILAALFCVISSEGFLCCLSFCILYFCFLLLFLILRSQMDGKADTIQSAAQMSCRATSTAPKWHLSMPGNTESLVFPILISHNRQGLPAEGLAYVIIMMCAFTDRLPPFAGNINSATTSRQTSHND